MRMAAIMRHGEPEDLGENVSIAAEESRGLSALGRRQAEAARAWLAGLEPVAVLCSDSPRAIETARIAGAPLEPTILPDLAGLRLGVWEEQPLSGQRDRIRRLVSGELAPPEGGETVRQVAERAQRALDGALPAEGNVLVVAHRLTNAVLIANKLGLEPELALRIPQDHAAVSLVSLEDSRDRVLAVNVTPLDPLRLSRLQVEDL
jgi:broad specificity phosphatase PhoE